VNDRDAPKLDLWLPGAAEFFGPPRAADAFDPSGSWEHTYVILDNAPNRTIRKMQEEGFLRIRRRTSEGDLFALDVELVARKQRMGSFRTAD
jgi:hypothetical protein